ncbi:hypothetical protein C8R47DRAFT_292494 [Mycena vitilis]|nr:hypothetical protein C8R47DRAFT_292494 [Mycena vitilis]
MDTTTFRLRAGITEPTVRTDRGPTKRQKHNAIDLAPLSTLSISNNMVPPALDSEFLRSLPDPPNLNVVDIRGNTTDAEKHLHAKGFFHLQTGAFGKDICRGLRLTSLSFDDERHQCELILEIEIVKGGERVSNNAFVLIEGFCVDMTNFLGVLHGACTTLLAEMYVWLLSALAAG